MTNDEKIVSLMNVIKEKKESIGAEPKFRPATTCNLCIDMTMKTNIHTIITVEEANKALMMLGLYELACEKIGIDANSAMIGDFSISDWKKDLLSRKELLEYKKKVRELNSLESQLNGMMSDTKKTELALGDIEKLLKG